MSIATLEGREIMTILVGGYAKLDQWRSRGQADLIYVKGEFYLCAVVEQPEEPPLTPEGYLGVDLGIVNITTTSDDVSFLGEEVEETRKHYAALKAVLQRVGAESTRGTVV